MEHLTSTVGTVSFILSDTNKSLQSIHRNLFAIFVFEKLFFGWDSGIVYMWVNDK